MANPSVVEARAFGFSVMASEMTHPIARLIIKEVRKSSTRAGLEEASVDYGFEVLGDEGVLMSVSPGYWPFVKACMDAAVQLHSPACVEDCATKMGHLIVIPGEPDEG